jgi:hypothetical protein
VVGRVLVRAGAHHNDRVVEDVVGQVTAHLRQLFDAADLLPDFAPQLVALAPRIVLGDVGIDTDRHRLGKFLVHWGIHVFGEVGHHILLIASRKD